MLTLNDCIAFSGLSDEQLEAIARHEHLSMMLAAEMAEEMVACRSGCARLAAMLIEEAREAARAGDCRRAAQVRHALHEFLADHPGLGHAS
jgi:hypothetical protein